MSQQDLDLGMLDKMINYCLHKNKSKLDDELISKIHNLDLNFSKKLIVRCKYFFG